MRSYMILPWISIKFQKIISEDDNQYLLQVLGQLRALLAWQVAKPCKVRVMSVYEVCFGCLSFSSHKLHYHLIRLYSGLRAFCHTNYSITTRAFISMVRFKRWFLNCKQLVEAENCCWSIVACLGQIVVEDGNFELPFLLKWGWN